MNYGTKSGSKHATGDDTVKFVKKVVLAGLKSEIDKVDIGKLETTPSDFKGNVKSLLAFVLFISFWMVLNIPELQNCQVSAYASVTQGSNYAWIYT